MYAPSEYEFEVLFKKMIVSSFKYPNFQSYMEHTHKRKGALT